MSKIWFWLHWLLEHTPKYVQDQFTSFCWLTTKDPREGVKIILKLFFLTWKESFKKVPKTTIKQRKFAKMP